MAIPCGQRISDKGQQASRKRRQAEREESRPPVFMAESVCVILCE